MDYTRRKREEDAELVEQFENRNGDMMVELFDKYGIGHKHLVKNLVFESIHGMIPDGYEVYHRDGDKKNNAITNLMLKKK